uniref:Uncharacterized protein n=1 Tax=Oncorhynchus kisutch TaxID=8019 RepID=A0A8C7DLD4_ONCKI
MPKRLRVGLPRRDQSVPKTPKSEVDILSPAAMQNVYYISHNAVDCKKRGEGKKGPTK